MNHEIDRLLARQACMDLVLRAAAFADAGDAQALAQLFAEDGQLQRPGGEVLGGRTAIAAAYSRRPAGRMTRHLVTNTLVELQGPDRASAQPGAAVVLRRGRCHHAARPPGATAPARRRVR